jgi:hypothetical protein
MRTHLRSIAGAVFATSLSLVACNSTPPVDDPIDLSPVTVGIDSSLEAKRTTDAEIAKAFADHVSNLQVLVRGTVTKHLADDVEGDAHQRFILRLESGQTLLIAHNVDLATRVPATSLGKIVYAYGEYEWNDEGGVVHWTHNDPAGVHAHGWIQFEGVRYE